MSTAVHFTFVSAVLSEALEYRVIPDDGEVIFEYVSQIKLVKTVKKVAGEDRTVGQDREFPDSSGTTDPGGNELSAEAGGMHFEDPHVGVRLFCFPIVPLETNEARGVFL